MSISKPVKRVVPQGRRSLRNIGTLPMTSTYGATVRRLPLTIDRLEAYPTEEAYLANCTAEFPLSETVAPT